ncbi:MaoC family dehydratase N-terminal domain-containing protein [Rhodococcus sp. IEGM 1305]|uniref:FAS1-like dehydratase domain-containing protein n=1 Tax=Rhodococcus sp. IEGM 1305 TaxID=3047092 RepID=UPI0024B7A248|nr:MaoC family dehydratase N-terminal domain-containing protein [Rhodococcus sp. IEGM 1305]
MQVLVGYDLSQMMHTDQQLILHRPVQVGNRLDCEVCLESFRQMGGTDIIVTKNLITDQHEEPVATTRTTLIARTGGVADPELARVVAAVMIHKAPTPTASTRYDHTCRAHVAGGSRQPRLYSSWRGTRTTVRSPSAPAAEPRVVGTCRTVPDSRPSSGLMSAASARRNRWWPRRSRRARSRRGCALPLVVRGCQSCGCRWCGRGGGRLIGRVGCRLCIRWTA